MQCGKGMHCVLPCVEHTLFECKDRLALQQGIAVGRAEPDALAREHLVQLAHADAAVSLGKRTELELHSVGFDGDLGQMDGREGAIGILFGLRLVGNQDEGFPHPAMTAVVQG